MNKLSNWGVINVDLRGQGWPHSKTSGQTLSQPPSSTI